MSAERTTQETQRIEAMISHSRIKSSIIQRLQQEQRLALLRTFKTPTRPIIKLTNQEILGQKTPSEEIYNLSLGSRDVFMQFVLDIEKGIEGTSAIDLESLQELYQKWYQGLINNEEGVIYQSVQAAD